jgi:hypothetical protein
VGRLDKEAAVSVNEELLGFVREALTRGVPRTDLESALRTAGWPPPAVQDALGSFADAGLSMPVPRPRPSLEAREAFLYLVLFGTLYVAAFNLGSLLFDLINYWLPDPSRQPSGVPAHVYAAQAIRWSSSALIVATPVFLAMTALTAREIRRDPIKRASKVRRALTYATLLIAAVVLIGDVTTLVYNVLGGELTTRFLLKVLVVAAIAASGFGYYLATLRADEKGGVS